MQAASTTVQLASSTNPSIVGNNVFFTAVVTSSGGVPTGTVTFFDGSTKLGQGTLSKTGQVTFSSTTFAAGSHAITASYGGDTNDGSSTSAVFTQVIQQTQTAITLVSGSNPAIAGVPVSFAATISSNGDIPSGTLQLMEGKTVLATSTISSAGAAQFAVPALSVGSHTLVAYFGGDANHSAASSSSLIEVVQLGTSATSLSATASLSAVGSSVVVTAKVTGTGNQPTGTVTFLDGTNSIGTAVLSAGVATFSTSSLGLGSHTITATYPGDTTHSASAPATLIEVVQQTKTAITLVSGSNPAIAGTAITLAATISSDGGVPSGQLQLMEGTAVLATSPISSVGGAQFSLSTLSPGSHTLVAVFAGNANYGAASSSTFVQVIQLATSSASLTSSANPSVVGSSVVFTVRVTGTGNQPTGTVTFLDGAGTIGTGVLSAGVATLSAPNLSLGSHPITANYAGDTTHSASAPATLTQLVQQTTTTTLSSSANPSIIGSAVTLTATVTGTSSTAPSGTVSFYDGSTLLGSPAISGGSAVLNLPNLAAGPHLLLAKYAGDSNSFASDSASLTQVVNAAATTISLTSSSNPALTGSVVVFTATVVSTGSQATGTVTFMDGATVLGTGAVANQIASLSMGNLSAGQHAIVARYGGDTVDQGSTSTVLLEVVQQHTSTSLIANVNPLLTAQALTLTATVTGTNPNGTVTFLNGTTTLGQVVVSAGTATIAIPSLPAGMGVLTAVYSGDSYNLPSTSSPLNEPVSVRPSATTMTASSQTYASGDQITLVAVIQVTGPVAPTGTVTFTSGGQTIGTANVASAGAATLTFEPSAASYSITATYSGDAVYLPSTATPYSISQGAGSTFSLLPNPASVTMASGDHTTLNLTMSSTAQFADTLSLACLDLPVDATCTFSVNQVKLTAGGTVSAQLVLDTGLPLGAGPRASLQHAHESTVLEAATGISALLLLLSGFPRTGLRNRRRLSALFSLLLLLLVGGLGLSGCGSSLNVSSTPTGTYNIRVLATGNTSRLTQTANVTLEVK